MPASRRSFLVGAGSIITASFLRDAKAFVGDTRRPLLLAPENAERELFVEWLDDVGRLHLGTPQFEIPPPPLWIDHLKSRGYKLDTAEQINELSSSDEFYGQDLWEPLDEFNWEDQWENTDCPEAQAYELLKGAKIFPRLSGYERKGRIVFESFPNPMSSARWVEVHGLLSLSLLQARLNELDLGIAVHELP